VTRPPLDNPKVRNALSLALDRVTLLNNVVRSGHLPATGLTPPGAHPQYEALNRLHFDPVEARRLLAEAGFPEGRGFRKIEILTNTSGTAKTVAEFFQESWRKHLGIEVSILQQDWQVYLDNQRKLNFDIARAGWVGDYSDPFTFLSIFRSTDGNNNTGWANAHYDELMLASTLEKDVEKRMKILHEGEDILLDELPVMPIFWRMNSRLERPEVRNWKASMLSHRCYKAISLGPYHPFPPIHDPVHDQPRASGHRGHRRGDLNHVPHYPARARQSLCARSQGSRIRGEESRPHLRAR
jgi:oligopeptide transport system substrate-binding protein